MPRERGNEYSDIIPNEEYPWIRFRLPVGKRLYFAFSRGVRKKLRKESDGSCDECGLHVGANKLTVAHINHQKDSAQYNDPENARLLCDRCECEHHLSHVHRSDEIGMPHKINIETVWGHLTELKKSDIRDLAEKYPSEIQSVCSLLHVALLDLIERG